MLGRNKAAPVHWTRAAAFVLGFAFAGCWAAIYGGLPVEAGAIGGAIIGGVFAAWDA